VNQVFKQPTSHFSQQSKIQLAQTLFSVVVRLWTETRRGLLFEWKRTRSK